MSFVEYVVLLGAVALLALGAYRAFGDTVRAKAAQQAEMVLKLEGAGSTLPSSGSGVFPSSDAPAATAAGAGDDGATPGKSIEPAPFVLAGVSAVEVCFVAGTAVATPSGPRPVEDLRTGDLVVSRDEHTGESAPRRVVRPFVTPRREVVEVELERPNGARETLGATAEHPFRVAGRGWVASSRLTVGDLVESARGGGLRVIAVRRTGRVETVHNIEVDGFHTYFAGTLAAWVHNACKEPAPVTIAPDNDAFADFHGVDQRKKGKDFWVAKSGDAPVAFGFTGQAAIDSDAATNVVKSRASFVEGKTDYVDPHYQAGTTVKFETEEPVAKDGKPVVKDGKPVTRKVRRPIPANEIPYVALPPKIVMPRSADGLFVSGQGPLGATQVRPGDYVRVSYAGKSVYAIFVDVGPKNQVGEVSMYVAESLGFSAHPSQGGVDTQSVTYEILPGSGPSVPAKTDGAYEEAIAAMSAADIQAKGKAAFEAAAEKGWLPKKDP